MAIINSSIARKVAMALSGLFLVFFLLQHLTINFSAVVDPDTFNSWSHFMGYNPIVQFVLQPILILAIVFHFVMGIVLELQNNRARNIKYGVFKGGANASWATRNMIVSGAVILAFLGLHMYDFWFPEIDYKFIAGQEIDATRYYDHLVHKFESPVRVGLYCLSFVLLALHLWHGFASSFQSMGWNNKYSKGLTGFTKFFAVAVPLGFVLIAIYIHLNN